MGNVKEKRHWLILCGCTILNFAAIGIIINTLGLYFNPIIEDMGYSRTAVSMLVTILTFVNMLVMFFIGKLYKKYSAKRLILIFGLIAGVAYAMYSRCNTINQFYICAALVGLGVGGSSVVPASILVTRWFNEKRGFALGIAFSGSGLGGMVFAPISTKLIYTFGYKTAFLVQGISIIILFVLAYFIIENSPEDIGLKPYGYKKVDEEENTNKKLENYGLSFKEARKKPYFYGLMITGLIIGITNLGTLTQIPSFLIMNGYSENFVALVITLYNVTLIFGKLAYGFINDKIGTYKGNVYVISLWIAAIAVLPFAANMRL